jgi:hypothetical protein
MDAKVFDSLARKFAERGSRRAAVTALLAISGLFSRPDYVSAQTKLLRGQPCTATDECSTIDGCGSQTDKIVCGDNGYDVDGPLTCCGVEGLLCHGHAECCGSLMCIGGWGDGCGAGSCRPPETIGILARGQSCTESHQCSQSRGETVCSVDGLCCTQQEGATCVYSVECCYPFTCVKPPGTPYTLPGFCGTASVTDEQ